MLALLMESDPNVRQSIELMLKTEDIRVAEAEDADVAVYLAKDFDYDILVIDDGGTLRQLRTNKIKTPILVLSGMGIYDRIQYLRDGADDCLAKPFHKDELVARIHALVRRSNGHAQSRVIIGDLTVDLDKKTVEVDGASIHLSNLEYRMVELLALRKGFTLTKEMFMNHLYGGRDEPEIKIIDVIVCKLRKKLATASEGQSYIETIWGRGYTMREPAPCQINYVI